MRFRQLVVLLGCVLAGSGTALAKLPTGYLVWVKGKQGDQTSRKVYRLTLPGKTDEKALTSGEDVSCQISPDGKWVAYAKAKLSSGTDYHSFKLWKLYIVSIHGVGQGRQEIKIDDSGYWPSWGDASTLYYNQADDKHSKIYKVTLDEYGAVKKKELVFSTKSAFASSKEVNECFMSPDGSWFAARTRGALNGVGAFAIKPPKMHMLAQAGNIGCMPYVAPSGTWGLIAGADQGIRWGDAPTVSVDRKQDQLLIAARPGNKAYHPGISTDEKWVMAAQGTDQDHNAGPYDVYIYELDQKTRKTSNEQALVTGEFNGWPHIWVGTPGPPPPPKPQVAEFYPSSYTLVSGEKATLTWSTRQAETVELDSLSVAVSGSQDVTPTATTTYTLVAKSSLVSDTDTATCKVAVNATATAVAIDSFTATPKSVDQGSSVTLSWKVSNPTTLDLDGTRVAPEATLEVTPQETTTYKLTAKGHQGPVSESVTVTVKEVKTGPDLHDDRGGFVCGVSTRTGAPGLGLILLACLLVLRRLRRRR
jgi:hypothetical protein